MTGYSRTKRLDFIFVKAIFKLILCNCDVAPLVEQHVAVFSDGIHGKAPDFSPLRVGAEGSVCAHSF